MKKKSKSENKSTKISLFLQEEEKFSLCTKKIRCEFGLNGMEMKCGVDVDVLGVVRGSSRKL